MGALYMANKPVLKVDSKNWSKTSLLSKLEDLAERRKLANLTIDSVLTDPWLRDKDNSYINSSPIDGLEDLTISALIHPSKFTWNENLIHDFFAPNDVVRILSIPILHSNELDKILWKFSRDWSFSVKSIYFHIMEHMLDNSYSHERGNWTLIWR
ncbi:hypothetical protein JHK82_055873 [Glycine max]|nr:hypothetical protein JHK82_055873 [Glycine max]